MVGMHLDHVRKNMRVLFLSTTQKPISKKILGKKFIILKSLKLLILIVLLSLVDILIKFLNS